MSQSDLENRKTEEQENDEPSKGPSLILMYSLIALAMVVATAIAAIIVLPFYLRR